MKTNIAESDNLGLEEAEMYARFAQEMAIDLHQDPSESKIAAVYVLIEKSRRILQRLIDAKFGANGEEAALRR